MLKIICMRSLSVESVASVVTQCPIRVRAKTRCRAGNQHSAEGTQALTGGEVLERSSDLQVARIRLPLLHSPHHLHSVCSRQHRVLARQLRYPPKSLLPVSVVHAVPDQSASQDAVQGKQSAQRGENAGAHRVSGQVDVRPKAHQPNLC
jgi:hypothetical protein